MRERTWKLALIFGLSLALANLASGDAHSPEKGSAPAGDAKPGADRSSAEIARNPIAFQIPNRGAPTARIGGATRSAGADALPQIEALVPEEPGWTLREQPVLYWYLASTTATPIEFVLLRLDPVKTLAEVRIPRPAKAGIQAIALADHGLKLEPGVSYQWLVKLVPNPDDRSYDRVVGGGVDRVVASPQLQQSLAAPGAAQAQVLAGAGIWYDALDDLSRAIAADPKSQALWNERASLFEQAGLPAFPLSGDAAPGLRPR